VLQVQQELDAQEPVLPRRRKAPRRFEIGTGDCAFPDTPKEFFRQHYFEVLDLIVNFIKDCFNQPGHGVYRQLQDLLLKAARRDFQAEFDFITKFYGDDFNSSPLKAHLE